MSRTSIIIRREYLSRVKKKTFIIMTILGPILFAALMIVPIWLAQIKDTEEKTIAILDDSFLFVDQFEDSEYLKYEYLQSMDIDAALELMKQNDFYAVLYIPHNIVSTGHSSAMMYSYKQPGLAVQMEMLNHMEKYITDAKLQIKGEELGVEKEALRNVIKAVETNVDIKTRIINDDGEQKSTSTEIAMIIGYIAGFLIYMFVFMYGSQVMRGVIEEKSNRIVEIIVSSVRPFKLMMGKIIGIALVGLTQFILWIVLTFGIVTAAQFFLLDDMEGFQQSPQMEQLISSNSQVGDNAIQDQFSGKIEEALNALSSINFPLLIGAFLFYFLFGYLLYAGMFAAVGAAVDNEADTQQFMLPISLPLVLGLIVMFSVINSPESSLAWWFSIIPFTSPIVMMVRIPFGVPVIDLVLSFSVLILSFIFMVWLSGKIYRIGILMYGKKVSYKELWKWIRYKN